MPATRTQLVAGPARVLRDSKTVYTQDDLSVNILQTTIPHATAAHGHLFETADSVTVEATFTPDGRWTDTIIAMLWPYLNFVPGTSIFTTSDVPTVIHGADGQKHTIPASAIGNFPTINLSAGKTMIGPTTILGVRTSGTAWTGLLSVYDPTGTGADFSDAGFLREDIVVQDYTGVWGTETGLTAIKTQDGWTIEGQLDIQPISTDEGGILDYKFVSVQVMARCMPVEATMANIMAGLKVQNAGAARGRRLCQAVASSEDLVITGTADTGAIITLKHAGLKTAGFRFGASILREGEIGFVAARPFAAGATTPIAVFEATSA